MADLPRRAVTRTAKLASLPIGYAGRTAWGLGKRLGGAPAEAVMTEVQARTAEQLFRTLGELKGGAMKLGQALSIFEGALPEQFAAPYREHLTRLQDAAPPMSTAVVHQQLVKEFGAGWKRRLIEFDDIPAAAASIGQVHRGRWVDGTAVAVKIQYPGAEDAMRSDLRQVVRLAKTFGGLLPGIDVKALALELQDRVSEELDYDLEAEAQAVFAEEFADDPDFVVPAPVTHTRHVLVSQWLDSSTSLAALIGSGTAEERNHYGRLYARFLFGSSARTGMLHADPHPGNFRLIPGADGGLGRLGVLDYGAVARLPDHSMPDAVGHGIWLAGQDDYEAVVDHLRSLGFIKPGIRVSPEEVHAYLGPFAEPTLTDTFHFTRDYMRAQMERLQDPRTPGSTVAFRLTLPPEYLLLHRTWVGAIGVLCQLDAEIRFRDILESSLPGFGPQNAEDPDLPYQ